MLAGTGRDWKGLEGTGRDWKGLEGTGRDWKGLEGTGRDWKGPLALARPTAVEKSRGSSLGLVKAAYAGTRGLGHNISTPSRVQHGEAGSKTATWSF